MSDVPEFNLRQGARVDIELETIADWVVQSSAGLHGAHQARALLRYLEPEQADDIGARLASDTTPPDWY
jgi:uncharacterized protein YegJ (DUF2314 family)